MPERSRLTALIRGFAEILGAAESLRRGVAVSVESSVAEVLLRELYTIRSKQPDTSEMIESIRESLGLDPDAPLVRLLREAGASGEDSSDRSG